jgi:histidine ammonia-lyase
LSVRATMLARLNTLLLGGSGVHKEAIFTLVDFLNKGIEATIYEKGGVGASGDLVQLAHLALNMIGEGEVMYEGRLQPTSKVMEKTGARPMNIHVREGLGIMNGTSAMSGVGMVNLIQARKLINWSVALSAMTNEIMESFDDHFSEKLNDSKKHPGQSAIARAIREILHGSQMVRSRSENLYNKKREESFFIDKVQEYYSLRCVPQILGPVLDTIEIAEKIIQDEINSVNDNPVIDFRSGEIYHGGNFHGDYVAFEMDKLKIAITKLCMLSERQLNYILNDKLNQKLPPFLNLSQIGLNFGLQGIQYTATSSTAENQTLSFPMYIHSIPNNNDNQDIVSMGCNAALLAKKVLDNTTDVLAIQAIGMRYAVAYLQCENKLSPWMKSLNDHLTELIPDTKSDYSKHETLQRVKNYLHNTNLDLKL